MSLTYAQLKTKLRGELWPHGESRSLVSSHDSYFKHALFELQRWVECLTQKNVSTFAHCATYWEDAKTVVAAPKGIIRRVYTVANDEWRDKVHYVSSNFTEIECWAKWLYDAVTPANEDQEAINEGIGGFKYPEQDVDKGERARTGIHAIHNGRLYLAPWIESNELVVVEWDGKKDDWVDGDVFDEEQWNTAVQNAIKQFVLWQHELFHGDPTLARLYAGQYAESRADLIYDCREETRQRANQVCQNPRPLYQDEIDDDAAPDETTDYVVCAIGDIEDTDAFTDNAAQIVALDPGRIILGGDNTYETAYGDFLDVFDDWRTTDQATTRLFALIGNHDRDVQSSLENFLAYFAGNKNNKRYFSFVYGPVHFFVLSTDSREADGGYVDALTSTQTSEMGQWLQVQLALSTAKYKVVLGHHGPYMSDTNNTPGNQWMRWPFADWGADMYLNFHGHNFEHVQVSDFDYITCGNGGHSLRDFGANTSGTILKQFNSDYGFLKLTANCDALTIEHIDREGNVQYEYEYTN